MKRNVLFTSAAVVNEEISSSAMVNEKNIAPSEKAKTEQSIAIPDDCKSEFVKAMKIGYYKEFYKQGLITDSQLEKLIQMQDKKQSEMAA